MEFSFEQPVVSQRSPRQDGVGLTHNQHQLQQQQPSPPRMMQQHQQQRPSPPRMMQQFSGYRGAPLHLRGPPPTPSPPFRGPSPILPSPPQENLPRRQRHHSTSTSMVRILDCVIYLLQRRFFSESSVRMSRLSSAKCAVLGISRHQHAKLSR
jgi:hypothetical protein